MDAIARSQKNGRARRSEAVIQRMKDINLKTGNESVLPDKVTYTSLIKALHEDRIPGCSEKGKALLKMMEEAATKGNSRLKPDLFTYSTVLNALSYDGYPEQCEELVDKMESEGLGGNIEIFPDIVCYNKVMASYRKQRRRDAAKVRYDCAQEAYNSCQSFQ